MVLVANSPSCGWLRVWKEKGKEKTSNRRTTSLSLFLSALMWRPVSLIFPAAPASHPLLTLQVCVHICAGASEESGGDVEQ